MTDSLCRKGKLADSFNFLQSLIMKATILTVIGAPSPFLLQQPCTLKFYRSMAVSANPVFRLHRAFSMFLTKRWP